MVYVPWRLIGRIMRRQRGCDADDQLLKKMGAKSSFQVDMHSLVMTEHTFS